jgi:hypothetical protein
MLSRRSKRNKSSHRPRVRLPLIKRPLDRKAKEGVVARGLAKPNCAAHVLNSLCHVPAERYNGDDVFNGDDVINSDGAIGMTYFV